METKLVLYKLQNTGKKERIHKEFVVKGEIMKKETSKILFSLLSFAIIIFSIFTCETVKADENAPYYTNLYGQNFTKEEYTKLTGIFGKSIVASASKGFADKIKSDLNYKIVDNNTIYVETIEKTDLKGNVLNAIENVLSEKQAKFALKTNLLSNSDKTYKTSMKKLTMTALKTGASNNFITVRCDWLKLPSTRSIDVIAIRPCVSSISFPKDSIAASQTWDGNIISYSPTGKHVKSSTELSKGGVGVSMNIKDDVKRSLVCDLAVTFVSGKDTFSVCGTYQHAKYGIKLKDSMDYTFSSEGYGGVLKFAKKGQKIYDRMKGLKVKCSLSDYLN